MDNFEETPRMRVSRATDSTVTVRVWDRDGDVDPPASENAAMTWEEIDRLATDRGVPPELIFVDDDAAAFLGPRWRRAAVWRAPAPS
jgi:hypothetical protein